MAIKTSPMTPPAGPVAFARYPLVMHRGEYPNHISMRVHTTEQEDAALADGWGHKRPALPDPEPEKPVLTLEQRVEALEATVLALITPAQEPPADAPKRGPGRPKKEHSDGE